MFAILFTFFLFNLISAAPIPAIITRYHTAAPVTQVVTQTTGTTTVWLPPVGIYVLADGSSSTSTVWSGQWNTYPATFTSVLTPDNANTQPDAQPTTAADTTPTPATTTAAAETTANTQPTNEQNGETTPAATTAQPETTSTAAPEQQTNQQTTEQNQPATEQNQQTQQTSSTTSSNDTPSSSSSSTSETSSSSESSGSLSPPSTIVYSPYADDRSCKSSDEINSDLQLIYNKGIKQIRSYGTDCGSLSTVLSKCNQLGIKVNQGVWVSQDGVDSADDQIDQVIEYGQQNGWDIFNLFTFGNEAINSKYVDVDSLMTKLDSVRTKMRNAGYNGPVTTAEPPATYINYPQLCTDTSMDIVAINPHSYFNEGISPDKAGDYVTTQQSQVAKLCKGKLVWITETGYPSQGATLGLNVPSPKNQEIAIKSILDSTGGDVTILTTYNDFWKDPGPYGIEQYFGTINLFS